MMMPRALSMAGRFFGGRAAASYADKTDGDLLQRAGHNDETACRELLDRYGPRLYGIVEAAHGDLHAAEDIVQEAFIRAIQQRAQLRSESSLFPWIVRIALRVAIDLRRKTKRETLVGEDPEVETAPENGPDRGLEVAEDVAQVKAALAELKPYPRELLVLRYFSGFSVAELADVYDKSEVAIRKDLQRARDAMRVSLGEWFYA
jgi:RNA polymerase sigma-70 factor, ECF subfamily